MRGDIGRAILVLLDKSGSLTTREIAAYVKVSDLGLVQRILRLMVIGGDIVQRRGSTSSVYARAQTARTRVN